VLNFRQLRAVGKVVQILPKEWCPDILIPAKNACFPLSFFSRPPANQSTHTVHEVYSSLVALVIMATFAEDNGMDVAEEMQDPQQPSFPPISAVDAAVSSWKSVPSDFVCIARN
jgi:hypothetical protein